MQFLEILKRSKTVDSLPSLKSIYKKVNRKITAGEYPEEELTFIEEAFREGVTLTIEDGTKVQLLKDLICAGHSSLEKKETYAYRIDENKYRCLTCHRTLRKIEEVSENILFPLEWPVSDAEFFRDNTYPYTFAKIIADARDISELPSIPALLEELKKLELLDECNFDQEKKALENSWAEGMVITIGDGTKVKLTFGKRCVLHRFNTPHIRYSYQVEDNGYLCGNCLEKGAEHPDMMALHPQVEEELLFPLDWTRSGIDIWLENVERRIEAISEAKKH
ncbi:hypothetical protein ACHAL6_12185 [Proteiniclasticum sp. C24MP]|uniref:hypothetical protein n=1 Tax=Proteiniclasticum sp. C24MP TaxID=3374101 RepID=UPI0037542DA6